MKAIILLTISVIILSQSYGLAYAGHGGHHYANESIVGELSIGVDSSSYTTGDTINISGFVSDYEQSESDPFQKFDVTLKVIASNNNIISISQIPLDNDGTFSTSILSGGPLWKSDGAYTISASHGPEKNASITFVFVNSESEQEIVEGTADDEIIEISEEEMAQGCGDGTHLEDGVCVLDETVETTTSTATTGTSPSTGFNSWIYSISFTVLIAFAIMIVLYLISRASRNKSDD